MSMLSAQIDKLRYEADMLRDHGTFIGYGGLTSTDPEMIECADLMCDAADTIWQLRDDLQKANAENARLRKQVADACMQLGGAWARCTELRELLQRTWDAFHDATAREFVSVKNELRELGIEVDQ